MYLPGRMPHIRTDHQKKGELRMQTENTGNMDPAEEVQEAAQTEKEDTAAVPETDALKSLEKQRQQLEREKEELRLSYLRLDTKQLLKENGLPEILADHVMASDFEKTKEAVAGIRAAFDNAVQQQVAARLAGRTPQGGSGTYHSMDNIAEQVKRSLA